MAAPRLQMRPLWSLKPRLFNRQQPGRMARTNLVLMMTGVLLLAGCQSAGVPPYEVLAQDVVDGKTVDASRLRTAFIERADASAELTKIIELERQALALMVDQPLRLGAIGNAILESNYASLTGHLALQRFYTHLESDESAAVHEAWLVKLQALIEENAGSIAEPYRVYSAAEAEAYLLSRDLELIGSMYHTRETHPFVLLASARPLVMVENDNGSQTQAAPAPQAQLVRLQSLYFDLSDAYRAAKSELEKEQSEREFAPIDLITYLGSQGDTAAQAFIGTYMASENRTDDAIEWLKAASQRGNLIANLMLARAYWSKAQASEAGERTEFRDKMLDNYTHAIALGSDEAMFALGSIYLSGEFGDDNKTSGVALLEQAADIDNESSALLLAHMHYRGEVVDKNLDTAENYFHKAADVGGRRSRMQYARFLFDPKNERIFTDDAYTWLEELASNDDPEAMLMLGNLHAKGISVEQNFRRAISWFKSAVSTAEDDANIVNEVAWTLTVTNLDKLRSQSYALRIMDRMMRADEEARANPAYLDTWAAAHAANGKFSEAIDLQKRALQAAKDRDQQGDLEELNAHLKLFTENTAIIDPVP